MTQSKGIYATKGRGPRYFKEQMNQDTDECIEWPFGRGSHGYGVMTIAPHTQRCVHVVACELAHGPRPKGHEVAHSCDNRRCFNPRHLRWATRQSNVDDMILRDRQNFGGRSKGAMKT